MILPPPAPGLASLAAISLRIGNLTFGGGDPAMAALQRRIGDSDDEFFERLLQLAEDSEKKGA